MPIKPSRVPGKTSLISNFPGNKNQESKSPPLPSIPGYIVLKCIGEGGMGKVFLGRDETLDRKVAIKMISDKIKNSEFLKGRFLIEAKAMAKLGHPNVGRIYTFVKHENEVYFIMEHIEGESLSQRLKRVGRFSVDESLRILKQVILALEAAWEKKIIHRDVKPSNIIIDKKGQAKVIDFGLAKDVEVGEDSSITTTGIVQGTPHYISPEQIQGNPADYRSDIYSAGIMLYEMLVGECPFQGTTPLEVISKHLQASLPLIKEKKPDIPDGVQELSNWMTQKDSAKRPSSYAELLDFIDSIEKGQPPLPEMEIRKPQRKLISLKWATIVSGVLSVLIVLGIISGLFFKKETNPVSDKEKRLVVATAPFYGPDEDSAKEGLVMGALVEKSIKEKLGEKNVRVIGIKKIKEAIQDHENARKIGKEFNASFVVWGEAFAVKGETEIQPYFTKIPREREVEKGITTKSNPFETSLRDMQEKPIQPVLLGSEVPNQIELRKTTAGGIGDMVLLLAGLHALQSENNAQKALSLFSRVPESSDSLRYSAYAFLRLNKEDEALMALKESVLLNPKDARSYALMGDIYMEKGEVQAAVQAYKAASETGRDYTTKRAIYFDKKLFVRGGFRSRDYLDENRYLLAYNRLTGKVSERYCLPGIAKSFKIQNNSIHITYEAGRVSYPLFPLLDEIIFSNGKFDRPVFYGMNYRLRYPSNFYGLNLIYFIDKLREGKKIRFPESVFTLRKGKRHDKVLANLRELENCLRNSISEDPTQPWHLFLLGWAMWEQGQKKEAEKTWQEMISGEFPAIPYYEYSYMAGIFERIGQEKWANKAYDEALKRRKQFPRSIGSIDSIERYFNAFFVGQAAEQSKTGQDMERAYLWLERSREISGPCLEFGYLTSMLWEKYFREHGDVERANKEAAISKRIKENPLNGDMAYGYLEYAALACGIVFFGFLVFSLFTFTVAFKRCKFKNHTEKKGRMWLKTPRWIDRLLIIVLITTALSFQIVFVLLFIPFILFLKSRKFSLKKFAASIYRAERKVLVISLVLVLVGASLGYFACKSYMLFPYLDQWGFSDSLGHAFLVHSMEESLKENNSSEAQYASAVMNHMAGNVERASELYETFPHDPYAQKNLAALKKGNLNPPAPLTAKDLFHGYKAVPGENWFKNIYYFNTFYLFFSIILGPIIILILSNILLLFVFLRTPADKTRELLSPSGKFRRRLAKILFFLIPGIFDIRKGSPLRGLLIISLAFFVLFTGFFVFDFDNPEYSLGTLGIYSFPIKDSIYSSYPLPHALSKGKDLIEFCRWDIFWGHPGAKIFWISVILSLLIVFLFHIARFRKIWRLYK